MGYKLMISLAIVTVLVAFVMETLIRCNHFTVIYDHFPGQCTKFELNGSEDLVLFPNDHVLISSGLDLWENELPPAGIFMVNLKDHNPHPVKLTIEGNFLTEVSPRFVPHGVGSWVTDDGKLILYVVNHRENKVDTVESFLYLPSTKSLQYRKTISCPECRNLNDVVAVGEDEVYVTRALYTNAGDILKTIEAFSRVSLGSVWYLDARDTTVVYKQAAYGFWYPNGIARSNDGRLIFLNECGPGTVTAFTRREDNTLQKVQVLTLELAPDNLFVSPENGHLWLAFISKPLEFEVYKNHPDPASAPVGGRVLHVAIDQNVERPFDDYAVEEVFSTSGKKIGATSGVLYHKNKLIVGTIRTGMMICDAPYLIYD